MKKSLLAMLILCSTTSVFAAATPYSPYVDLTLYLSRDTQYPTDLPAMSQASGINNYHLAFITDAGNCQPAWGSYSSYSVSSHWSSTLTDQLRQNNIHYFVSFGGAAGNDISANCSDDALLQAYQDVINIYHPDGLDFDIENGTANVAKIMRALAKIQAANPNFPISFTLPVMPEGLVSAGEDVVTQAKQAGLNFSVNIMTMDYGPSYSNDMGQYAIQAANSLFNFLKTLYPQKQDADLWKMISLTPMIGVNDVNSESFTLADVDAIRNFANQNHLNTLAMWSIARDYPCANQWAQNDCSGNNLQTSPYQFSTHFMGNTK